MSISGYNSTVKTGGSYDTSQASGSRSLTSPKSPVPRDFIAWRTHAFRARIR